MCGIAGIFAYSANSPCVDEEELLAMREAMASRGPDGAGLMLAQDHRVGLAHRRLSIIDLSDAGAQPMSTADGRLSIVFNGEIYNHRELRAELEQAGYRFASHCDTEVLLHLYDHKGWGMFDDLRGMYAFALWDRQQQGVLLACDPFGMKPLYYSDDGRTLRFASQVKSLLAGGRVDTSPDPAGHVGFFLWGSVPQPHTLYRGVRALEAGTALWVDTQGVRRKARFCSVAAELARVDSDATPISPEEMRRELRAALQESVAHHLIADVPVSLFLSAGLDSATLTALASEVSPGQLKAVTLSFEEYLGTEADETPMAAQIAQHCDVRHTIIGVRRAEFAADRDAILRHMDQPTLDGINTYFVSKAAASAGIKVALSGVGGDEIFGGYPSFGQVPRSVRTLRAASLFPPVGRGFRLVAAPFLKFGASSKYAGLLEYGGTYPGAYLLRRGLFMPWELPEVLDPDLVREGWEQLQPLAALQQTVCGLQGAHDKVSALELSWYMRNQLLRDTDWAGMAHSLEIRTPLVDLPLLRRVVSLARRGQSPRKGDMAAAPCVPLPQDVLGRRKTGFSIPVQQWLQPPGDVSPKSGGLREWAKSVYATFVGGEAGR